MQTMKASVRTEAVDSSKKRPKVVVHTASSPQRPTSLDSNNAGGLSTSEKDQRAAMLKCRFADTIFKAQQQMKAQGSKRRPEPVVSSKNTPKAVVQSTLTSQLRKEPMRTVAGSARFPTSDKDLRVALLKSRFEDTIFKAQQEIMKASLDNTQGFDLKNSVGSKRKLETVDRADDLSKKRPKVSTPAAPKEEKRTVGKKEMTETAEQRRDSDRRAARIALERMTNTAGIELNLDVQRQFDILVGYSSSYY
ncbi:hypothetical protein V6N13_065096 [Hibiscus sabdariffa]|uniref:Uncharacterized protein n=1 Tax=Hibiscus sabdariffa TaxID=183260 RepID=A0ABR2QSD1_9ROSI